MGLGEIPPSWEVVLAVGAETSIGRAAALALAEASADVAVATALSTTQEEGGY